MKTTYTREEVIKLLMLFSSDCSSMEELNKLLDVEDTWGETLESFTNDVEEFLTKQEKQ